MNLKECASNISWGKVLAGAAIVAGAIMMAPVLAPAAAAGVIAIGHAIMGLFAGGAAGTGSALVTALTGTVAREVAGAALLGGGIMYFSGEKDRKNAAVEQNVAAAEGNSFAMREDMRKMQALMVARAQAAGYQPAMAMAGNHR
jgi:hypothetical protein